MCSGVCTCDVLVVYVCSGISVMCSGVCACDVCSGVSVMCIMSTHCCLRGGLTKMVGYQFPLKSSELVPSTPHYIDYISVLDKVR